MLPKPEKTKKLNNNFLSDSEITKESDEVIAAKKITSKRKIILISLVCTAGLSLLFWTVKNIQSFIASPHPINLNLHFNFKFPDIKFGLKSKSSANISDTNLNQFLSDRNWSAIIFKNYDLLNPVYRFNFSNSNIDDFISELSNSDSTETSNIISGLPEGLSFREKIDISQHIYGLNINLPDNQLIFIVIDNNQSETFPQDISSFINQSYWYSISRN